MHWGGFAARHDLGNDLGRDLVMSSERSHTEDPSYGIRKLVDIALKGLASGPFTDPTTAVQAIDRVHDALRQLVDRRLPPREHRDDQGAVRLTTSELDWSGFVRLSFDEVRLAGAASPQVRGGVRAALEDLLDVAPPDRRSVPAPAQAS